jgi:hypothetical protein
MKKIFLILVCLTLFVLNAFGAGIRKTSEGKMNIMYDDYEEDTQAEPKDTGCQFTRGVDFLTLRPCFVYTEDFFKIFMNIEYSGTKSYSKIIFIGENSKMIWEFSSNKQEYDNKADNIFGGHNPYADQVNASLVISKEQYDNICEFFENNNPTIAVYNTGNLKKKVEEMKPYAKRAKEIFKVTKEYFEKHELTKLTDATTYCPSELLITIK